MSTTGVHPSAIIDVDAVVPEGVHISPFAVIQAGVTIGARTSIGVGVVLHPGTTLGEECEIQDYAVIGKSAKTTHIATLGAQSGESRTEIARGVTVGTQAIVYRGCKIGERGFIGDQASIRENCIIGAESVIGRGAMLEFSVRIGERVLVFSRSYLCEGTTVESEVFIGACISSAAGKVISYRRPAIETEINGPTIQRGARVGTGAVLHPGVSIGAEGVVALGATVFEDVAAGTVVMGHPARAIARVPESEHLPE